MSGLHDALTQYVEVRRALGTTLAQPAATLAQFVAFLEQQGAAHITTALALQWAMTPQGVQRHDMGASSLDGAGLCEVAQRAGSADGGAASRRTAGTSAPSPAVHLYG